jgi:hypothetical protein
MPRFARDEFDDLDEIRPRTGMRSHGQTQAANDLWTAQAGPLYGCVAIAPLARGSPHLDPPNRVPHWIQRLMSLRFARSIQLRRVYQPKGSASRNRPPRGPSSGSVAAQTTPAALSVTGRAPIASAPGYVAVNPGQTAFTMTDVSANSAARVLVRALRAALLMPYVAAAPPRAVRPKAGSACDPAPLLTLTIRGYALCFSSGRNARIIRQLPNRLTSMTRFAASRSAVLASSDQSTYPAALLIKMSNGPQFGGPQGRGLSHRVRVGDVQAGWETAYPVQRLSGRGGRLGVTCADDYLIPIGR